MCVFNCGNSYFKFCIGRKQDLAYSSCLCPFRFICIINLSRWHLFKYLEGISLKNCCRIFHRVLMYLRQLFLPLTFLSTLTFSRAMFLTFFLDTPYTKACSQSKIESTVGHQVISDKILDMSGQNYLMLHMLPGKKINIYKLQST